MTRASHSIIMMVMTGRDRYAEPATVIKTSRKDLQGFWGINPH